jgi:hypothetical protein
MITVGLLCLDAAAYGRSESQKQSETSTVSSSAALLWRNPGDIESMNLLYGPGSAELEPKEPFSFVKEITGGATQKFEVVDGRGVHWIVKIGEEAKSETAATRLLWAAGYFTDEAYYISELRVAQMPKLLADNDAVSKDKDGIVQSVRMEPMRSERMQIGNWSWSKNPFIGTKEMNGLRIMMALINNWDLKKDNNAIYSIGGQAQYVVSDLGASFGKTGGIGSRTKSRLDDYAESKFIDKAEADLVDLRIKSRPFFLLAVDPYHYNKLTSREKVGREIPRDDAKWLGQLLGRLSLEQIRDCFRAAGYSRDEVDGFAQVVQSRIADLNRL